MEENLNLDADLAMLDDFVAEEPTTETEEEIEEWLDYYYNMMLPELQEGKFTADEKLSFIVKILSS